jgi:hypothetical protein
MELNCWSQMANATSRRSSPRLRAALGLMGTRAAHPYRRSASRREVMAVQVNALRLATFDKFQTGVDVEPITAPHREEQPTGRPTSRSTAFARFIKRAGRESSVGSSPTSWQAPRPANEVGYSRGVRATYEADGRRGKIVLIAPESAAWNRMLSADNRSGLPDGCCQLTTSSQPTSAPKSASLQSAHDLGSSIRVPAI